MPRTASTSDLWDFSMSWKISEPSAMCGSRASFMRFADGLPCPHLTATTFLRASIATAMQILFLLRPFFGLHPGSPLRSESVTYISSIHTLPPSTIRSW